MQQNGTDLYYSHPVQVRYWDAGMKKFIGGVAYKDFIVCGCCGRTCSITDILWEAAKYDNLDVDHAIIEMDWIDINQEIIGE